MTAPRFVTRRLSLVEAWNPQRNETRPLPIGRQGLRVRVDQGLVLVTQAGDPLDHVLEPGAELRLDGSGLVVAWALEPSSVRLFRDRAGRPPRGDRSPRGSAPPSSLAG
jgi:hypothetical protein